MILPRSATSLLIAVVGLAGLAPSLPLHGTADTIVPLHIHSQLLSPHLSNATLTVIPGAGHMPHHAPPDAVRTALDRASENS